MRQICLAALGIFCSELSISNFWQNIFICHFYYILSVIYISVEVGKYGRIVLPRRIRRKYGLTEGYRLIVTESMGRICLTPVKTYDKPTEALYGSLKTGKPIDEPKNTARDYMRKKLLEEMQ
jgi:AbrB family looped-hinge helix DNA binding protein